MRRVPLVIVLFVNGHGNRTQRSNASRTAAFDVMRPLRAAIG
jgi:hypothetical protein